MFVMMGGGLHRRNFIGAHAEDIPLDTMSLVSMNTLHIFPGTFTVVDDYPEKPYPLRTKLIIASLFALVFVSALTGYLIGSADYAARLAYEPPDPIEPLKPSASRLHVFQKAAVCTDAPQCSEVGK
ncbi:putative gamma glutamyl transpeptidase [Operophtera brumata]|uniref:Putative gamma glutamyl transpeptidase n=1 Tax=Operophtera brumata TaxID=104452 RepID=A0A0L7KX17_OPEBR|nr:putative gamma glutamyl transpeptidase [Operophtera brumata]